LNLQHWATPESYYDQQLRWLEMEGEAERLRMAVRRQNSRARDPERSGETIVRLKLSDHRTGLAGRLLLDLSKADGSPLPMNRLRVGSPVVVSDDGDFSDEGRSGVVSRRTAQTIQVALEQWPTGELFRVDLSPDDTTRRRQAAAIQSARSATGARRRLRDSLLGLLEPRFDNEPKLNFFSELNPPQQAAVRFALSARDAAILHGPPGTGKTTTLAEVVYQAVARGDRVLACSPSNTGVDNLLEKLVNMLPSVLRVGHPARVFESLRGHTLDELVESDASQRVIRELWREVEQLMRRAGKPSRSRDANRQRGEMYAEAGQLRQQARSLEKTIIRSILDAADVICTTTTIDEDLLGDRQFDLVVIDEAGQCTEPAIWQAALRGERIVLAGDHCQLPPTVVSEAAAREGFAISSLERLVNRFGEDVYRRLIVQYRMHEAIMRFSSEQFYDRELVADQSVEHHRLVDLPHVSPAPDTESVLQFWDTAGAEWWEELEPDGESKLNRREAQWVVDQVRGLLETGLQPQEIAVIAPYAAQVRLIRNRLQLPAVEVDTVDGFQGREKEAVVLSLVRSNDRGEVGFLRDTRRTNVALTRARRHLRIVGDSATLAHHPFYAELVEYFQSQDAYRSVWELV
jgi:ATP-dependent RNA/DNA helicase IGHMBP2